MEPRIQYAKAVSLHLPRMRVTSTISSHSPEEMMRFPAAGALLVLALASACSGGTGDNSAGDPSGTANTTARPLGGEIAFQGGVPSSIDGDGMSVAKVGGDALAADDGWAEYFRQSGIDADEFIVASSIPGQESDLQITVAALTAPVDWKAELDELASSIANTSDYEAEQVSLGGVNSWHVSSAAPPSVSTYYHESGNTLWVIDSADEGLVSRILRELSASSVSSSGGLRAAYSAGETASGQAFSRLAARMPLTPRHRAIAAGLQDAAALKVLLLRQPEVPVCVAEPFGRQQLMFMITAQSSPVPVPAITEVSSIMAGEVSPTLAVADASPVFQYKANLLSSPEQVEVHATVPGGGGDGFGLARFPVQHCLNGLWQDEAMVVQVDQTGSRVLARKFSGSLCGEETEVDFEGTTADDRLSGPRALFCNPSECVEAGLLPLTFYSPFTATISLDGQVINGTWDNQFYDFIYDDQDRLIDCRPSTVVTDSFTVTRNSFGPGLP
jgi:hypothetical protein